MQYQIIVCQEDGQNYSTCFQVHLAIEEGPKNILFEVVKLQIIHSGKAK
jgi:hypothetical protein